MANELALSLILGDSKDYLITVTDDGSPPQRVDLSKAVDGTPNRPAIVRFAAKRKASDWNADAVIFKRSYVTDEIAILPQTGSTVGQCKMLFDSADTDAECPRDLVCDVEIARQDFVRSLASVGTIAITPGSSTIRGSGTTFSRARVGDILQPLGANPGPAIVTGIADDTTLVVDRADWLASEASAPFELRRARVKTGASGTLTLSAQVVD